MAAFGGLLLAMLLASLDTNIVATALPTIAGELGGLGSFAWVTTAYLLTVSVSTPLYGKLGDLYGRKPLFLFALAAFLAGSALCGAAQSMPQLIGFRVLQGLGGGGLIVSAGTIYADLFRPEERARYQGWFTAVFAAAAVAGPLLGGFVTDRFGWRWVFYLNLPLGAVALLGAATALRLPRRRGTPRIDYPGVLLLGALATCLTLATSWGGERHAWTSPVVLGLGAGAVASLAAWLLVERAAAEPVVPPRLFRDPSFSIAIAVTFLGGFALFGGVFFVPLFLRFAAGTSATGAGLLLLPLTAGLLVVSLAGPLMARVGGLKWFGVAGVGSAALGMGLLAALRADADRLASGAALVLLGIGLGLVMQVYTLAVQNTVPPGDLGAATATVIFVRQVGGALGLALFGALFNRRLGHELAARLPPGARDRLPAGDALTPEAVGRLPAAIERGVVDSYAGASAAVFLAATLALAVSVLLALVLKPIPLREPPGPARAPSSAADRAEREPA